MRKNYGFTSYRGLERHYDFHCEDENHSFATLDDYGSQAEAFLDLGVTDDIDECTRQLGLILRYHRITQEFIIITPDGFIVTYYFLRPKKEDWINNRAYYREQCRKP